MIELTDEMRGRLASALADGYPVVAASIDADGYPKLSFFGSCQVYSDDQLAVWHRSPEGGLIDRLETHRQMAFIYRHAVDHVYWQFFGRGHVDDDQATRKRVYEGMPEIERALDPDRKGRAIIVDVDRVRARNLDQRRDR